MKKQFILILALAASIFTACNSDNKETTTDATTDVATNIEKTEDATQLAAFEFDKTEHDFGDIKAGDVVKQIYKFKNTGAVPLVISNIEVQCGCTTPSYTSEPIAPGAEGEVVLQFNSAGKSGQQHKISTIKANVPGGEYQLVLKANVTGTDIDGPRKN